MAKKKSVSRRRITLMTLMHLSLGMLFLVQGIHGLVFLDTSTSQIGRSLSKAFGGNTVYLELVISLMLATCGLVITASYFMNTDRQTRRRAWLGILVLWVLLMAVIDIVLPNFHSRYFDWLAWVQQLLFHIIVLLSILIVRKN